MKNYLICLLSAVLFVSCKKDEPEIKPGNDDDFIVVEGSWNLRSRHYILYDSLNQVKAETLHQYGPGNWLTFISGGVFNEFENGTLVISGKFTNENNILTLKYNQETHFHQIDTLTQTKLVYHQRVGYANKDYHIFRTTAEKKP